MSVGRTLQFLAVELIGSTLNHSSSRFVNGTMMPRNSFSFMSNPPQLIIFKSTKATSLQKLAVVDSSSLEPLYDLLALSLPKQSCFFSDGRQQFPEARLYCILVALQAGHLAEFDKCLDTSQPSV
jgi:hypothetical protein